LAMFDCGPAATHKLVKAGLWPTKVDHLFFTHHHFDHDVDYPCFLLCRWDQSIGRENRLQVFGPTPTERIAERLIGERGAFTHDWQARVGHPLSQRVYRNRGGTVLPRPGPSVEAKDVGPGVVFAGSDWEVRAAPAEHVQPFLDSLAYRVETPTGSVVFTGPRVLGVSRAQNSAAHAQHGRSVLGDQLFERRWTHPTRPRLKSAVAIAESPLRGAGNDYTYRRTTGCTPPTLCPVVSEVVVYPRVTHSVGRIRPL